MCYEKDTLAPLAEAIEPFMTIYSAPHARSLIEEHTRPAQGQRSTVTATAESFYEKRRKLKIDDVLRRVVGTDNQLSALREAIMINLREQAGMAVA